MEKKIYAASKVFELGTVKDLTAQGEVDKCDGSGDAFVPSPPLPPLSMEFGSDC